MTLKIEVFKCFEGNFGFLIHDEKTGKTISIDAGDENVIFKILKKNNWVLSDIFITHHEWDHTDGLPALKKATGAKIYAPLLERDKIITYDKLVKGGDIIPFGEFEFTVINTFGHTLGHVAYFEKNSKSLFCGDALFSLGCGRMREGTPEMMWEGLKRLNELPDETLVYCGHEYSKDNAKFARFIDPNNEKLKIRQKEIDEQLAKGEFTIPTSLGDEKIMNPFLRCEDEMIAKKMGLENKDAIAVFASLRKAKDVF